MVRLKRKRRKRECGSLSRRVREGEQGKEKKRKESEPITGIVRDSKARRANVIMRRGKLKDRVGGLE